MSWADRFKSSVAFISTLTILISSMNFANAEVAFRHSSQNAGQSAAYIEGSVNAKLENGKLHFRNNRSESVMAYIHDAEGNIVSSIIVPGKSASGFSAAVSTIAETGDVAFRSLINSSNPASEIDSLFRNYFNEGSSINFNSGITPDSIPEGGTISYAIGLPETVSATYINAIVQGLTIVIEEILEVALDGSSKDAAMRKILNRAYTDADLVNSILSAQGHSGRTDVFVEWVEVNASDILIDAVETSAGINAEDIISSALGYLNELDSVLNVLSTTRDGYFQDKIGPTVLFYDMAYDTEQIYLEPEYRVNWIGTPLDQGQTVVFDASGNDSDDNFSLLNPFTWSGAFNAEYQRYSSISNDSVASNQVDDLRGFDGVLISPSLDDGNDQSNPNIEVTFDTGRADEEIVDIAESAQPTQQTNDNSQQSSQTSQTTNTPTQSTDDNQTNWTGNVTALNASPSSTFSVTTGGDVQNPPQNIGDVVSLLVTDPNSNNGQRLGAVQARVQGKYDHTAWGEWNGAITVRNDGTGQSTEFRRGLFVVGEPTPSSFIDQQTGTATYSGQVIADYSSNVAGTLNNIPNSVTGTISLTAGFEERRVGGNLVLSGPNNFSANASIDASFYNRGSDAVGYGGTLNSNSGSGIIDGTFFGQAAEETGGSFSFSSNTGENATGVFFSEFQSRDLTPASANSIFPRFGSASYSGNITGFRSTRSFHGPAVGFLFSSSPVHGDINLKTDFFNRTIGGDLTVRRQNGTIYRSSVIQETSINESSNSAGFSSVLGNDPRNVISGTFGQSINSDVSGRWHIEGGGGPGRDFRTELRASGSFSASKN